MERETKILKEKILRLKEEKDVLILAHFYANSEVQDIADKVGDSFKL
ncbi:MAG: quinolinate synthase NadA, partial [Peptostreptococcus sp.]|nr:quinolinate synthase NadA [Peptostreptococcus sp.]